jgi:hypothetical protein
MPFFLQYLEGWFEHRNTQLKSQGVWGSNLHGSVFREDFRFGFGNFVPLVMSGDGITGSTDQTEGCKRHDKWCQTFAVDVDLFFWRKYGAGKLMTLCVFDNALSDRLKDKVMAMITNEFKEVFTNGVRLPHPIRDANGSLTETVRYVLL